MFRSALLTLGLCLLAAPTANAQALAWQQLNSESSIDVGTQRYTVPTRATWYRVVTSFHLANQAKLQRWAQEHTIPRGATTFGGVAIPAGATTAYFEVRFWVPVGPGLLGIVRSEPRSGWIELGAIPNPGRITPPPATPPTTTPTPPTTPTVDLKRGAAYMIANNAAGSATIIGSQRLTNGRYRNTVLTAGHTFDGYGNRPITVKDRDLRTLTTNATMIRYSLERQNPNEHDLALLSFTTDRQLQTTPVARLAPRQGDRVAIVGKGWSEQVITVHRSTIGVDSFWGTRPRTTTPFQPISGHSGGGLLNARGEVVGVVSGNNGSVGLYAPLAGIHAWLDRANLSSLYR